MRNSLWILFFVSIAFAFSSCSSSDSSSLVGNWTSRSPLDGYTRTGAVSFTIGDYAYVGLGYNATKYNYYKDLWRFDPTAVDGKGNWAKMASFPGNGRSHAVAFVIDGKAYVGTGNSYNKTTGEESYYDDFYQFVPNADSGRWVKVASFPDKRYYAVAFSIGGLGFVGTGEVWDGTDELAQRSYYQYDPTLNKWSIAPSIGEKKYGAVAMVIDGKAYVVGGYGSNGLTYDFWQFDGTTWYPKREIKNYSTTETFDDNYTDIMRYGAVGLVKDSKGYITCGVNGSILTSTWEYDPTTDLWTKKTSFEGSGRKDGVGFSVKNRIFVGTGDQGSSYYDDNWEFKPNEEYDENK